MTSPANLPARASSAFVASVLSLFIPGAGQFYLKKRGRGAAILALVLVLMYLINWALDQFKIGQMVIGETVTSWMWIVLALFWAWNVFDAYYLAHDRASNRWLGFLLPAVVIFYVAWQVTDVNLVRLVTRFRDAQIVFNALAHPDLVERDKVTQTGQTTFWVPCSTPPQPLPQPGGPYRLSVDRSCGTVGDTITLRGEGFIPGAVGGIYWMELGGTREARVSEGSRSIEITAGPDGSFEKTFVVPTFAGTEGGDESNPVEEGIETRFTQEIGAPRPSETFGDIIGKVQDGSFIPGKIFETIALGLMATFFSTILAIPLSFFAAHNIMSRVPGGNVIYYAMRTFLNVVRAVDTIIWGLIVIVWVGLGPFAGLIALTIHSVAALGKLYSEEIEHIDPGPIEAVTATGANLLQVIRYAVIPQIYPPFLAYTLLRWDINMRSATVVGFVAGGGIGFFVVETIRKGGYQQYAAALWAVAVVIIVVDYVSGR